MEGGIELAFEQHSQTAALDSIAHMRAHASKASEIHEEL